MHFFLGAFKVNFSGFLYIISEQGRLGIWALDGDPNHTGLLRYALTEQNFEHTLVVLVASMAHPWSILDSFINFSVFFLYNFRAGEIRNMGPRRRPESHGASEIRPYRTEL